MCVFISSRKIILIVFATVTTVLALVSSYTLYLYFGVASAMRVVEVSLLNCEVFPASDNEVSVKTDLRIHNPSSFVFHVVWANEKLYRMNGEPFGNINGYWLKGGPIKVPPFSNATLTISANSVQVGEGWTRDLYLSVSMLVDTPLPSDVVLDLSEKVSFSA